jgi:hypothetical protein
MRLGGRHSRTECVVLAIFAGMPLVSRQSGLYCHTSARLLANNAAVAQHQATAP